MYVCTYYVCVCVCVSVFEIYIKGQHSEIDQPESFSCLGESIVLEQSDWLISPRRDRLLGIDNF